MVKRVYVAETDGDGAIVCVWVKPERGRNAAPFDPKLHKFDTKKTADYYGANPMAVQSWLAAEFLNSR
ncbi:hypothetical protein ROA7450_00182 [Roseovarius albus]|uniref:Uncharacterized protein n=1 Tax=Roseovarius albus TaxID=1247867 RepID=A0A1X6Y7W0_9RHOB|nr:hypothetical protein ROA7450_00182 [Roseovarius albus]